MQKILLILLLITSSYVKSQCFQIENILVDGCDGSNEANNEMVRFKIGSTNLNTANLSVTWPSNAWLGVCQNATTNAAVNLINSTITGCGYLKQPVGGVLPANSSVIIVTSTDFNPTAQDFSNLNDTMYIIFQCPGNVGGHFGNFGVGTRTLTMNFSSPTSCNDQVIYDRALLIDQLGNIGQQDGGSVEYTPSGIPTYVNYGCQAPYTPFTVDAGPDKTTCGSAIQNFTATATGYSSLQWSLGSTATGSFSNANALITSYTPGIGDNGTIKLYCSITKSCGTQTITIKDSVNLSFIEAPQPSILSSVNNSLCSGQSAILSYSLSNAATTGTTSVLWKPSNSTSQTISVNTANVYSISVTNACGSNSATYTLVVIPSPSVAISPTGPLQLCPGDNVILTANSNVNSFVWNTGAITQTISVATTSTISITSSNTCGAASASISINVVQLNVSIFASPQSGIKPLDVSFTNNSVGANAYAWDFGNGVTAITPTVSPQIYTNPGVYTVSLTITNNGCSDVDVLTITVLEEDANLIIPNVFTPNGDNANDIFKISGFNIQSFNCEIFNRWGTSLYTWTDITKGWDGKIDGKAAADGTYFYIISAKDANAKEINKQGNLLLIR